MHSLHLGITTQTPLLLFSKGYSGSHNGQTRVQFDHENGIRRSPGGVSRMVLQTAQLWLESGWAKDIDWFSLQPHGPRILQLDAPTLRLHHLRLKPQELDAYARTKEKLWAQIHGLQTRPFDLGDFRFYTRYNWQVSDAILKEVPNLDVAYVHDFQLLQMGALVGLAAPSVLRWHVPFDPHRIPSYTRTFILRLMEDFDGLIVSTKRDHQGLKKSGYQGQVRQIYPHIDPRAWRRPTGRDVDEMNQVLGLDPDDPVIACVARMDPIKRQDLAIRALARLRRRHPKARLVLVGNGSFSGAAQGGLGLAKASLWGRRLQRLARELKVQDRVTFAHWIPDDKLCTVYERSQIVTLPSDLEGFGITVLEGWRYGRPVIVSSGVGAAEIVTPREDGLVFPAGDDGKYAAQLDLLLRNQRRSEDMGRRGRSNLKRFDVRQQSPRVRELLENAMLRYGGT